MLAQDIDRYVESNTIVNYTPPDDEISLTGQQIIAEYMTMEGLPSLPADWQWQYLATEGLYRGKFAKRVGKFVHNTIGEKLTEAQRAWLGKVAREHQADKDKPMYFDVTDRFDWHDGDYGDGGSCFWDSNQGARIAMEGDGRFYAIRFYNDRYKEKEYSGVGRAWLHVVDDQCVVIFNAYGPYETLEIAHLLAQRQGSEYIYKRITLSNHGKENGMLYINGCGGHAVCTKAHWLRGKGHYDFELDVPDDHHCSNCGYVLDEGNMYSVAEVDGALCESCFYDNYSYCTICRESTNDDQIRYVTVPNESRQEAVCSECYDDGCFECRVCGNHYLDEYMAWQDELDASECICSDCYDELGICSECSNHITHNENGAGLCDECHDNRFATCSKCSCSLPLKSLSPYHRSLVGSSPNTVRCDDCMRESCGYAQYPLFQRSVHALNSSNWIYYSGTLGEATGCRAN